jgi:Ca-activated chloride channel family protein
VVGRISAENMRSAADWAELARTTVTYGQHLQGVQQPVPESPVRDALAAVDAGNSLDAKAADWPQLRQDLESLLKKSDQPKPDQPPPQKQPEQNQSDQQKEDQQQQQEQQKDQQKDQQKQSGGSQNQEQQKKPEDQKSGNPGEQKPPDENQKKSSSAFGDMNEPPPTPPPSGETQKVGGAPEKPPGEPKDVDPALTLPLQKLEQLRNEDSPAKLFQLMEGEKKPEPAKKGKDW